MSSSITIGSDRYKNPWTDWLYYHANGRDCKKRLMNVLLDVNDMLESVESRRYDNKIIFDCLKEVDERAYLSDSAISCYSDVSSNTEIQNLQKKLHDKIERLHQLQNQEFFLTSTFQSIGSMFGFSAAAGFAKGRQLAVLDSKDPSSVEELLQIENEKRKLLGQKGKIIECKKAVKITQNDIVNQQALVENLDRQLQEAEKRLAEAQTKEKAAFSHMIDETSIKIPPGTSTKVKDISPLAKAKIEVSERAGERNEILLKHAQEQIKLNKLIKNFDIQENGKVGFWGKIGNFLFGVKKDGSGITIAAGGSVKF